MSTEKKSAGEIQTGNQTRGDNSGVQSGCEEGDSSPERAAIHGGYELSPVHATSIYGGVCCFRRA